MEIVVIKRDKKREAFDPEKMKKCIKASFKSAHERYRNDVYNGIMTVINDEAERNHYKYTVEELQDIIEKFLMANGYEDVAKNYILYRKEHERIRDWVQSKKDFIDRYKASNNTANATIDDNSNMSSKNIGVLNNEIHKTDNIEISRRMIQDKLREIYPDFDAKQYVRDLNNHIIYKHDESSFAGAIAPYCVSLTMYPFLLNGLKHIGGLSAAPKNLDSFCGMYINLIFAVSAQFAGAVATSEFLMYFDYFARKEWGDDYYTRPDTVISGEVCLRKMTIQKQIHQYFQQVVYSINQPAAARGLQSAFVNFSYFDKPFFEGMFGDFYFPDGTQPKWESLSWIQREFMMWFNEERLKCLMTFPVESFALVYKDGHFLDQDSADFVAEEYARGHSFFTYISDTVDSLSSCCRLRNSLATKEFSFTNGNLGVQTGSKSVITLNLNRICQNYWRAYEDNAVDGKSFDNYLTEILERVYKYHTAYNELLWDMYDAGLLPVYKAGFIHLDKQYLTIGLNGLNQAAEYLQFYCGPNTSYQHFCNNVFSIVKRCNEQHKGKFNGHQLTFNTEQVPAESLAIKNYNWDKEDGYWVPDDTNLYASYIFKPNDENLSVIDKIYLHGADYIGDYLDGGAAAHINLAEHLTKRQYRKILEYAGQVGCNYLTFNIPNCECDDCGYIAKQPFDRCPKCGSEHVSLYDRIIGYITKIRNWSEGRQIEQKTRVYKKSIE